MSRSFRFALLGPHPEIGFSIGQHTTQGLLGQQKKPPSPLQANPHQAGCTLNTLDFLATKIYLRTSAFPLQEQNKMYIKQKKENNMRALLKKENKRLHMYSFSQGRGEWYSDWTVNEIKLKAEIHVECQILWELQTHFCMSFCVCVCVCRIGDTNMYGLVQIKNASIYYFDQWSSFFIFSTPIALIHTNPIFFTPSARKSLVSWPLLQHWSWFQGCIKKSKLYSSVKQQQ